MGENLFGALSKFLQFHRQERREDGDRVGLAVFDRWSPAVSNGLSSVKLIASVLGSNFNRIGMPDAFVGRSICKRSRVN